MLRRVLSKFSRIMSELTESIQQATSSEAKTAIVETATKNGDAPTQVFKKSSRHWKYAMMLCYQGQNYFGMQFQPDHPTIEGQLFSAMHKLGWINEEASKKPFLFYFQRCARTDRHVSAARQIVGMQLPKDLFDYVKEGPKALNDILPNDIRVLGMRRATAAFHPQKMCNARTYSYTIPTYAFAKPHEMTNSKFRIPKETIDEINALLKIYHGTHNFYNYTSGMVYEQNSCNRYIMHFACGEPFLFRDDFRNEDVEFIQITVKGQSFILHQIRKMIGMVITVVRELQLRSTIQRSFENERVDVPKAPGLGLLLERVHFDQYDKRYAATHDSITEWSPEIEEEAARVKFDLITKEMLQTDIREQITMKWLASLAYHGFTTNNEDTQPAGRSVIREAMQRAQESLDAIKAKEAETNVVVEGGEEELPSKRMKLDETVEKAEILNEEILKDKESEEAVKEEFEKEADGKEEVKVAAGSG